MSGGKAETGITDPTSGGQTSPPTAPKKVTPSDVNSIFRYTDGCEIVKLSDDTVTVIWNNGAAVEATRGASLDYIAKHMHLHCDMTQSHYDIMADYKAMTDGKIHPKLAWVVCMMRQLVFSLKVVKVNIAETVFAEIRDGPITVHADVIKMMADNSVALTAIMQQAFTVLAMNGESLLGRGHHYRDDDKMWSRFINATQFDEHMTKLGIASWADAVFHDAFHPFDYDWLAGLVADKNSSIKSRINGVAARRLGTLPAGTTALGLVKPLLDDLRVRNTVLAEALSPIALIAEAAMTKIRKNPLNYCIHLARVDTAEKLAEVSRIEPAIAFMAGYLKALGVKGSTAMLAKSLTNIAQRANAAYLLGQAAATAYPAEAKSANLILTEVSALINGIEIKI